MDKGNGFTMSDKPTDSKEPLPKIDFSSFVLSLYSSGLVQLGKVEDPSSGKKGTHLDLAQHSFF